MEVKEASTSNKINVPTTVSLSTNIPNIDKLEGQVNYGSWKFSMKMYLMLEGLFGYVDGTVPVTDPNDKLRDQSALAKICLSVKPNCFIHVQNAKTSKEAWDNLQNSFEGRSMATVFEMTRRLFNSKQANFQSMEEYLTDILETVQKLADVGETLEDKWVAFIMMNGVSEEYETLISSINQQSKEQIKSEEVKLILLNESERRRVRSNEIPSRPNCTSALFVDTKRKPAQNYKKGRPKKIYCYNCGDPSHKRPDCPNLKDGEQLKCSTSKKQTAAVKTSRPRPNPQTLLTSTLLTHVPKTLEWVIDSGATNHMTREKNMFINLDNGCTQVSVADNTKILSEGSGDVKLDIAVNGCSEPVVLKNVMYVPNLSSNLLSVSKITDKGLIVVFDDLKCTVYCKSNFKISGNVIVTGNKSEGLYVVDRPVVQDSVRAMYADNQMAQHELWHKRLGHLSRKGMSQLQGGLVDKINFGIDSQKVCVTCLEGKQTAKPFLNKGKRAKTKLELVHSDVCGPVDEPSWGGARYCLIFVDDFTRKVFGYMIKAKSEVFSKFLEFKALVENETGNKLKCLRTDNGGEYSSNELENYLKSHGIRHQTTVPYTPQQNGVAERTNRTLFEKVRCMLFESNLDKRFWAEAMNTAIYLKNVSPTAAVDGAVPEGAWRDENIDISHLRVFGCKAQMQVPKEKRKKLDKRSQSLIFVGYCTDTKGYRLMSLNDPKNIIVARNVEFIESNINSSLTDAKICKPSVNNQATDVTVHPVIEPVSNDQTQNEVDNCIMPNLSESYVSDESFDVNDSNSVYDYESSSEEAVNPIEEIVQPIQNRYPTRARKPNRSDDFEYAFLAVGPNDPQYFREACNRTDSVHWKRAMEEEINALGDNDTWELVDRPTNCNVVKCKWVYKLKRGVDGSSRHKARLVAKGFSQKPGQDFDQTFAPVVKLSSLRVLFGLAAELDLEVDHVDITTAFLNGDLNETIFMEQPEGFVNNGDENKVCKLKKAIYGLKQAARCWNDKIHSFLVTQNFCRSKYDPCIYIKKSKDCYIVIGLHVDDFYCFSNSVEETYRLKSAIAKSFKMRDLGAVKECLGMRVTRDRNKGTIKLDQEAYVKDVIDKFGMSESNPVVTPLCVSQKLEKPKNACYNNDYQKLIGALMYLSVCTRPDICHAVSYLSQFNTCNDTQHFVAAKRVVRYLKGTPALGLCYRRGDCLLQGYADADFGNCVVDRVSYTGYVFKFCGAAVSYCSRKQRTKSLADSSTFAEYVAISECGKEGIYLQGLLSELYKCPKPLTIFNDNQSANKLCYNEGQKNRSKHIDVKYHQIRHWVKQNLINVAYLSDTEMIADMLTKGLSGPKHNLCVKGVGLSL